MRFLLSILFCFILFPIQGYTQNTFVYEMKSAYTDLEKDITTGFVSLSDNYPLSEHPDSLAVPDILINHGERYLELTGKYRSRLLKTTSIAETDSVYIYDYTERNMYAFPVNGLKTVAILTPYDMAGGKKFQSDYMIGFEIDPKTIKTEHEYLENYFASTGPINPFSNMDLHPIIWQNTDSSCFPLGQNIPKYSMLKPSDRRNNTLEYIEGDLVFYTQDIIDTNGTFKARHVRVINIYSRDIVFDNLYTYSEGTSVNGLNDNNFMKQWTGKLFKNQPPVLFGFIYQSFGCIQIPYITNPYSFINLFCDNRH